MKVGVPKERAPGERRVAVTPDIAGRLVKGGHTVRVERDAGTAAGFLDEAYSALGATIASDAAGAYDADLVLKVNKPAADADEFSRLRAGATLIAFLQPLVDHDTVRRLAQAGVTAISMDAIPRISRAQSMDALSAMSNCAGYKSVLIAGERLPKFFPLLMTAAGTIAPAKVLVLGAGVAGLQAVATARRLGAVVSAFDTRAVVKEQVESLGATFVSSQAADAEGAGGYAKALSEDQQARDREVIGAAAADSDVVITTALVPGKRAPLLITHAMLERMRPGSVIVDLAGEMGGNCEDSVPGKDVEVHGVTVMAPLNVPSTMPYHASQLYARTVFALVSHLVPKDTLTFDMSDEITKSVVVTRDGEIVNEAVRTAMQGAPA